MVLINMSLPVANVTTDIRSWGDQGAALPAGGELCYNYQSLPVANVTTGIRAWGDQGVTLPAEG